MSSTIKSERNEGKQPGDWWKEVPVDRREASRAIVFAACAAVVTVCAIAAPGRHPDGLAGPLAMGPDPGGKGGAGVTPETTRTDHPAAGGPLPPAERKTESKPPDNPKQEPDRTERSEERAGSSSPPERSNSDRPGKESR